MIQYIIAAGFGLWLGSQSKKSKKSYAHGGEVGKTYEIKGVDVTFYEDSYEEGELDQFHSYYLGQSDFPYKTEFSSKKDLFDTLNEFISYGDFSESDFEVDEDTIQTSALVKFEKDSNWDEFSAPTEKEKELWRKGKMKLYSALFVFPYEVYKKEQLDFAKGGMLKYFMGDEGMFKGGEYRIKSYKSFPNTYNIIQLDNNGNEIGEEYMINQKDFEDNFSKFYKKGGSTYAEGGGVWAFYEVTYKMPNGSEETITVEARNKSEALKVVKEMAKKGNQFTGGKFLKMQESSTYAEGGEIKKGDKVKMFKDEPFLIVKKVNEFSDKGNTYSLESEDGKIKRNNISYTKIISTYAEGGKVKFDDSPMMKKLWNERGYDIPYLESISHSELKGLYDTEFDNERAYNWNTNKDEIPNGYAKGGKMQGYDDRLDESLSMRDGAGRKKQQSKKDRRDESAGMEKSMGRRKYASVGTMDRVATMDRGSKYEILPRPAKDFIAYIIDMDGNASLKYSKTFQGANRMMQNMLKKNQDFSTHGVTKYDPFYGTHIFYGHGKAISFEPIKGFAKGGMTEHGLQLGDKIIGAGGNSINVVTKKGGQKKVDLNEGTRESFGFAKGGMTEHGLEIGDKIIKEKDNSVLVVTKDEKNASIVNLDKGIRANFEKGGETDFIQQVVDSPDFRKGAFTKKAKSRDLTTEEFMKKVLKNPDKYDERTRKQAQFMKNITS